MSPGGRSAAAPPASPIAFAAKAAATRLVPTSVCSAAGAGGGAVWLDGGERLYKVAGGDGKPAHVELPDGFPGLAARWLEGGLLALPANNAIAAFDPAAGAVRWTTPCRGAWVAERGLLAVSRPGPENSAATTIALLDLASGKQRWERQLEGRSAGSRTT